jgi:hypothetical protein
VSILVWPAALLLASSAPGELRLAERGTSQYHIVIPEAPIPSERYASEQLRDYLEKMSGCRLPIVSDQTKPAAREIVLGSTRRGPKRPADLAALGPDGFALRTEGRRLFITGGRPRGTLNGVYTLLEEHLGVRWFTPEIEQVPRTNRVRLPALNQDHRPALECREVFWTIMMRDGDFAAKHRLNGNHYKLTEKHGGRFAVYQPFVHSFDLLIPPDLYKEHPEYFPLINGKRASGYVQRCLSHPEVLRLSIAKVRQWIRENPQATIISVSQNDTANWCHCADCEKLDEAEGSPAATMLRFVNAIAEDIAKDYPHILIDTLAYQYTRKPPKTIRPRANVIVRLCSIECCFAHPLESCSTSDNQRFRQDILNWQPVAKRLYIWDYTPNFAHYLQPFPNFQSLQANVQFFVKHGVQGLFEQGNYSPGGGGEMEPLRAYLLAKLLWNPETDMARHTREFLKAYYGAAAPMVQEYLDLMARQVADGTTHARIFDPPTAGYLNAGFQDAAEAIWTRAEQAAANDEERFRVQVARLPVWYVRLATNRVSGAEREALIQKLLAIARRAGISHISEAQPLETWAAKISPQPKP